MSASGHPHPAQIRSWLSHPVIDADGHWLEYGPVFSEQIRKVGGDKAAPGFLSTTQREAQTNSVAERQRRRLGQEGFWKHGCREGRRGGGGEGAGPRAGDHRLTREARHRSRLLRSPWARPNATTTAGEVCDGDT